MKFQVGNRVQRLSDVFNDGSRMLHGTVTDVYTYQSKDFGFYPEEMYAVRWDDWQDEVRGYLPHGLDPEEVL